MRLFFKRRDVHILKRNATYQHGSFLQKIILTPLFKLGKVVEAALKKRVAPTQKC